MHHPVVTIHAIFSWTQVGRSGIFGREIGVPNREVFSLQKMSRFHVKNCFLSHPQMFYLTTCFMNSNIFYIPSKDLILKWAPSWETLGSCTPRTPLEKFLVSLGIRGCMSPSWQGVHFPWNNWSCSQNIFVGMFPLFPENSWPLFPENNCPCSLKITAHVPLFSKTPKMGVLHSYWDP